MKTIMPAVVGLLLSMVLAAPLAAQPRVTTSLDRNEIFDGESVTLGVELINCPEGTEIDVSALTEFDVEFVGVSGYQHQQVRVNRRWSVITSRTHVYRVRPKKTGRLSVPPVTVEVEGKTIKSESLVLRVKPIEPQDYVMLSCSASKTEVFRREPFTVQLEILVRDLPAPHDNDDPLTVQARDARPNLDLPWAAVPEGLEGPAYQHWAVQYVNRRGNGFTINETRDSARGISLFDTVNTFLPKSERVRREGLDGKTHSYHRYLVERRFNPVKAGTYSFGPVALKGQFATGIGERRNRFGRVVKGLSGDIFLAVSNRLTVTVREAPEEGRPATYTGGVGSFTISATAAPTTLRVGDPLTVTIHVDGATGLDDVGALELAEQPAIAEKFRVYEDRPTGEVKDGRKVFVHSLRPLDAGVRALPPIQLSFFDPDKREYVTVSTEPVPLEITAAEKMNLGDVVVNTGEAGETDLVARADGIFANITDVTRLGNQRIDAAWWFGGLAAAGALWALLALVVGVGRKRNADPAAVRRRGAFARGNERLGQAARESGSAALAAVSGAFAEVVASLRDVPAEGLTARDVASFAADLGDEALAGELRSLLGECEAAQFGAGAGVDAGTVVERARALMSRLQAAWRKGGRRLGAALGPWLLPFLFAAALGAAGGSDASAQSNVASAFVAAQARFDRAEDRDDFLQAAAMFRALLDDGYEDGVVLYNLGNAYYRAGELGHAIAAYRRAKRHLPSDDRLDANLRQALAKRPDRFPDPGASLIDHVFFWTTALAYRAQFMLMAGLAALAFVLATLRLFVPRLGVLRWATIGAVVATLLVAAGCALSYYRVDVLEHGVVIADKAMPLKAPNGTEAYDKPIHEGTDFLVLERRGRSADGWLRIRFAEGREGWIPADVGTTY